MELSIESACHHVTWKIRDFFQLPSEIGYSLDSPEFHFGDDRYCLRFYPDVDKYGHTADAEIELVRLTSALPEKKVSCKLGFGLRNPKGQELEQYFNIVTKKLWFPRSDCYDIFPDATLTLLCSMCLGSRAGSPQSEEAETSNAEEEQEVLPGQSVIFSSRWRSLKMELSIESPCQTVAWKVRDFFHLPSEIDYSVESPEFRVAGDRYCLRLYPNGDRTDTNLQLVRLTSSFPERIVLHKIGYRQLIARGLQCDIYVCLGTLNDQFIFSLPPRSVLEERKGAYVPDGTLTVVCSMRLGEQNCAGRLQSGEARTSGVEEKQEGLPGLAHLQSDYRRLMQKGAESDMCFVLSGKEFRAHRLVLRARSTVFDAMFGHETAEKKSGRVVINDLDPDCFSPFLEYLYTGSVEVGLSDDNAFGLYRAADKYDVPSLKSECVAHMRRNLSVDSFCDVMTLALGHQEEDLLQQTTQFFKQNLQSIILTAKWQQFVIDNGVCANELLIKALLPGRQ